MGRIKEFDESEVLKKAMALFWKQGYEKTSMNDLVDHMGIHRRSLYDTFGDKHSLFLKALDYFGNSMHSKLKFEVARAESAKQSIQFIFDVMIESSGDERHLGCLFVNSATELAARDNAVREKTEEAFILTEALLATLIRRGQETGEFSRKYNADLLAENLHNTLIGIRVLARTSIKSEKLHRIAHFSLSLLDP